MYRSVCVGFLYMLVVKRPQDSLETAVPRKASLLSFSVSMMKGIEGCWLFRYYKKSCTFSHLLPRVPEDFSRARQRKILRFARKPKAACTSGEAARKTTGTERFPSPFSPFSLNQSQRASFTVITWTGT